MLILQHNTNIKEKGEKGKLSPNRRGGGEGKRRESGGERWGIAQRNEDKLKARPRWSTGWEKAASKPRLSRVPKVKSSLREEAPTSRFVLGWSETEIVMEERMEGKIIILIQGPV